MFCALQVKSAWRVTAADGCFFFFRRRLARSAAARSGTFVFISPLHLGARPHVLWSGCSLAALIVTKEQIIGWNMSRLYWWNGNGMADPAASFKPPPHLSTELWRCVTRLINFQLAPSFHWNFSWNWSAFTFLKLCVHGNGQRVNTEEQSCQSFLVIKTLS